MNQLKLLLPLPTWKSQMLQAMAKLDSCLVRQNWLPSLTTIPRIELCAAILAVEMAEALSVELDLEVEDIKFFTDSKVVLSYIFNDSRRFYVYIHNRV